MKKRKLCDRTRKPVAATLPKPQDPRKESAKVSRTFRRFHAHGLIAKISRTRRWHVTLYGHRVMGTSLYLCDHAFPKAYSKIAA